MYPSSSPHAPINPLVEVRRRRGFESFDPIGRPGERCTISTLLHAPSSCCSGHAFAAFSLSMQRSKRSRSAALLLGVSFVACAHVRRFHTSRTAFGLTPKRFDSSWLLPAILFGFGSS